MSTDEVFRLRNGTRRPTNDSLQQIPEEGEAFLGLPTKKAAMTFLNPRKRKHIGVVRSLKVVANSSCAFLLCVLRGRTRSSAELYLVLHTSVEPVYRVHTPCMDITFFEVLDRAASIDVCSYVSPPSR